MAGWRLLAGRQLLPVFYESPLDTGPASKEQCFPALLTGRFRHKTEFCQWKVSRRDMYKDLRTAEVQCLHSPP